MLNRRQTVCASCVKQSTAGWRDGPDDLSHWSAGRRRQELRSATMKSVAPQRQSSGGSSLLLEDAVMIKCVHPGFAITFLAWRALIIPSCSAGHSEDCHAADIGSLVLVLEWLVDWKQQLDRLPSASKLSRPQNPERCTAIAVSTWLRVLPASSTDSYLDMKSSY